MLARNTFLWCILFAFSAQGQDPAGSIRITVKDPSGAAVAATGKLEGVSSGTVQAFVTDSGGEYSFTSLAYGRYRVQVTAAGFARQSVALEVASAEPVVRTVKLALSAQ